jgi:hypothetical protein
MAIMMIDANPHAYREYNAPLTINWILVISRSPHLDQTAGSQT